MPKKKEDSRTIKKLQDKVDSLKVTILELKEGKYKDSSNSSKPSSTNGFKKVIQNNRVKSEKTKGGQKGRIGKTLTVKMSSANHTEEDGYTLNYGDGEVSKIKYSIQNNGADFTNGGTVLTVEAGNTEGDTSTLTFTTSDENIAAATKSGAHTDTLIFTVEVN